MTQVMIRMGFDESMAGFVLPAPKWKEVLLKGKSTHC